MDNVDRTFPNASANYQSGWDAHRDKIVIASVGAVVLFGVGILFAVKPNLLSVNPLAGRLAAASAGLLSLGATGLAIGIAVKKFPRAASHTEQQLQEYPQRVDTHRHAAISPIAQASPQIPQFTKEDLKKFYKLCPIEIEGQSAESQIDSLSAKGLQEINKILEELIKSDFVLTDDPTKKVRIFQGYGDLSIGPSATYLKLAFMNGTPIVTPRVMMAIIGGYLLDTEKYGSIFYGWEREPHSIGCIKAAPYGDVNNQPSTFPSIAMCRERSSYPIYATKTGLVAIPIY